jgi:hypothetical protein
VVDLGKGTPLEFPHLLTLARYNSDVTNWNNYQNALNTYNQQYQAWQ